MKGILISFEGPEGSGKSTHIRLVYSYLKKKGLPVIKLREPGDTRIGEKIRRILLDPQYQELSAISETLLYMVCRSQLVEEKIIPYLKKRYIILCDRFLDSTVVYQGFGLGMDLELIRKLNQLVCKRVVPDLTIVLDIPVKEGLRRSGRIPDRIERRKLIFHQQVRKGYFRLAKMYPERIKIIPADSEILITQGKIRKLILDKLCLLEK